MTLNVCLGTKLDFSVLKETSNIKDFDCNQIELNSFLKDFSLLFQRRRFGITVVFFDENDSKKKVLGFYTICPASIQLSELPTKLITGPKPNPIPGFRLCRLAVDKQFQSRGFGKVIFMHFLKRCLDQASLIGGSVVIIDAKNEKAKSFYEHHGFKSVEGNSLTLVQTIKYIERHF